MTQQGNDSPACHGNGAVHCCYIPGTGIADPAGLGGSVCWFLEQNTVPGRKWVCGLRRSLGSWAKVHRNAQYKAQVQPVLDARGTALCGTWSPPGQCCFGLNNPPVHNQ